jgi:hypothetical protein
MGGQGSERAYPGTRELPSAGASTLKYLLTIFGHEATLRLGACYLDGNRFEAHAWIESGGRVLIGEFEAGQYTPFSPPRGPA